MVKNNLYHRKAILASCQDAISKLQEIKLPDSDHIRTRFYKDLMATIGALLDKTALLDPVLRPKDMFDPSKPSTAGRVAALSMVSQERHRLASLRPFYGSGTYALYYGGPFEPYSSLSGSEQPVYIGKADPADKDAKDYIGQGTALYKRLVEHARSIERADTTLDLADFDCRFLVVATGYQTVAEEYLIRFFKPIWNNETGIAYGIGKHGDKAETRVNARSPWDTLHPGRTWAKGTLADQKTYSKIVDEIREHCIGNPPHESTESILSDFMRDFQQMASAFQTATGETADVETSLQDSEMGDGPYSG